METAKPPGFRSCKFVGLVFKPSSHRIHVCYIHLHERLIFLVHVGKYTSPMDPMGKTNISQNRTPEAHNKYKFLPIDLLITPKWGHLTLEKVTNKTPNMVTWKNLVDIFRKHHLGCLERNAKQGSSLRRDQLLTWWAGPFPMANRKYVYIYIYVWTKCPCSRQPC